MLQLKIKQAQDNNRTTNLNTTITKQYQKELATEHSIYVPQANCAMTMHNISNGRIPPPTLPTNHIALHQPETPPRPEIGISLLFHPTPTNHALLHNPRSGKRRNPRFAQAPQLVVAVLGLVSNGKKHERLALRGAVWEKCCDANDGSAMQGCDLLRGAETTHVRQNETESVVLGFLEHTAQKRWRNVAGMDLSGKARGWGGRIFMVWGRPQVMRFGGFSTFSGIFVIYPFCVPGNLFWS